MSDPLRQYGNFASQQPTPAGPITPVVVKRMSTLALTSFITGGVAAVAFCLFFISGPLSLVSIVTGHIAIGSIRRSAGRLTGMVAAIAGLVFGYAALVLSIVVAVTFFTTPRSAPLPMKPGAAELDVVESAIRSDSRGHALGNSDAAKRLAESFATRMEAIDKELFTDTKAKIKLSGGQYVTWCELRDGQCAFVVHVPEYRRFTDEAKKALEELAWAMAQKVALEELDAGDKLALGLKGVILYGSVTSGVLVEGESEGGVERRSTSADLLFPFFIPAVETAEPPAQKN